MRVVVGLTDGPTRARAERRLRDASRRHAARQAHDAATEPPSSACWISRRGLCSACSSPTGSSSLKGSPGLRRAHLDQVVAAIWPLRAGVRREYSRVLAQRNALLARIRGGRASRAALSTWDRELASKAVELAAHRAAAVAAARRRRSPSAPRGSAAAAMRRWSTARARAPPTRASSSSELQARLPGDLRARLLELRAPPRRARDPARRARAAPVRLPGRAAPGAAGAAARRARRPRQRARPHAADAARRRDERAGLRAARSCSPASSPPPARA